MREEERKRLDHKGWKIGNAVEFLDLSPVQSEYTELKLEWADGPRSRRTTRKVSQVQVAKLARFCQSRVARMEQEISA